LNLTPSPLKIRISLSFSPVAEIKRPAVRRFFFERLRLQSQDVFANFEIGISRQLIVKYRGFIKI